ncbi:MAG TPA: hypothetical protein VGO92_03195, partial [Acidimicrobiales bacterium]|nr:hypothetical protein [Acidimicrobiales bacterium]
VETPADMVAQVNQFIAAGGKLDPKTSLTTGYDFLTDGSQAVDSALNSRIPAASRTTLINETWAKSDQLAALFPAGSTPSSPAPPSPDVNSLNAHYDHTRSLPALGNSTADESDLVSTADIAAHPQTLNKRLLFTMGCHAGLSMPKAYTDAAAKDADWAQAYLGDNQKAAVYLANTGFGYGDTATVALSEELMKQFASRLDGSMTVGEAATFAKQAYFGQLGAYGPYDEKAMQEAAFYGLPMWKIATAVAPPAPPAPTFMPTDEGNGVKSAHVNVAPTFTPKMSKGGGTFFTADAPNASSKGLQVTQYRPIEPKLSVDVTPAPGAGLPPNTVAHGVLITGLTSHDVPGVPAVARPVIDLTANEPPPPTGDVAFPTTFQTLSSFNTPQGERHHAVFMPGQFFHDASWANAGGVQRLFDTIGADVKYSNKPDFTPPQLTDVDAELNGTQLTISLEAFDSAGAVTKVLVLVKDGSGTWTPHELTYGAGGGYYSGTFTVTGTQFEYFAQAQDDAGNVGITTNKGRYFNALPAGQQAPTPPHLVTDPGHANGEHGWYRNNVKVTLEGLQSGVTYKKSVDGGPESTYTGPIDFTTDGSHSVKVNGSDGSTAVLAVVIDKTLPTIGATPDRPANANGWYNAPVTVTFNCADAPPGSGINTCTPPVKFSNEGTNQSATGKAVDFAGNEKSVSLAGIKVDKTAPLLGIFGVRDGGKYELGKGPGPFCLTYDFLSGGATCTGVTTGGLANGVGSFTYTATAKDRAGNTITKSVSYRVVYRWDGFGSPLCSSNDDNNHHDGDDDHDYDHEGD